MLKCFHCQEWKDDVVESVDPFAQDVCNEVWIIPSCDACLQIRYDDI